MEKKNKNIKPKMSFEEWALCLGTIQKESRMKAIIKINYEMLSFCFVVGKEINKSKFKKQYGSDFYKILSEELRKELDGFALYSPKNLKYMEKFYILYKNSFSIYLDYLSLLSWSHHQIILDQTDDLGKALDYVDETINKRLSKEELMEFVKTDPIEK